MAWLAYDCFGEHIFERKPLKGTFGWESPIIYGYDTPCIDLPDSTIFKIIGRNLTEGNEPVEI